MLRALRIIAAAAIFLPLTFLILDFTNTLPLNVAWLTEIQLIPAIMAMSVITLGILLGITLITGRLYCSTICPLGIWQDLTAWFAKWVFPKSLYRYTKPHTVLRWFFLLLFIASFYPTFAKWSMANQLDPYAIYGRLALLILAPAYILGNNILAWVFGLFDCYYFYYQDIVWPPLSGITILAISLMITYLAFRFGRIWCNAVCPVGTFLGVISRFALYKIRFDKSKCTKCGICSMNCKSGCIDGKNQTVDYSRCVDCFNCMKSCRKGALQFSIFTPVGNQPVEKTEQESSVSESGENQTVAEDIASKRDFLTGMAAAALTLCTGSTFADSPASEKSGGAVPAESSPKKEGSAQSKTVKNANENVPDNELPDKTQVHRAEVLSRRQTPIAPPGAKSIRHLTHHCTGCNLCVSKCPSHVLKPAFLEYGLGGMFQPVMSFEYGFCNFDCTACADVCPNNAIEPVSVEEKHLIQIGRVHFVKNYCIVYTEGTDCGACAEHCPTQAVTMVPYKGKLKLPEINPEICVGCGGCEHACPIRPDRAIFVEGNAEHQKAEPFKEAEKKEVMLDNFGF